MGGGGRGDFLGESFFMSVGLVLDIGDNMETTCDPGTFAADIQARESILSDSTSLSMDTCVEAGTTSTVEDRG